MLLRGGQLSELDQAIANSGRALGRSYWKVEDRETSHIRFLTYNPNRTVIVHERYVKSDPSAGITLICPATFEQDCPYCTMGESGMKAEKIKTNKYWIFSIWWREEMAQALMFLKLNGSSPLLDIHTNYLKRLEKGIPPQAYDFEITRHGGSTDTTYTVTVDDPDDNAEIERRAKEGSPYPLPYWTWTGIDPETKRRTGKLLLPPGLAVTKDEELIGKMQELHNAWANARSAANRPNDLVAAQEQELVV